MESSCSLNQDGRERQLERYARLAPSVVLVEREPRRLAVEFADGHDHALLEELVAVERECCPFLAIELGAARLTIAVSKDEDAPMLDVFAEALGAGAPR